MRNYLLILVSLLVFSCSKSGNNNNAGSPLINTATYTTNGKTYTVSSNNSVFHCSIEQSTDETIFYITTPAAYSGKQFQLHFNAVANLPTGVGTYSANSSRTTYHVVENLSGNNNDKPVNYYIDNGTVTVTSATNNKITGNYTLNLMRADNESIKKTVTGTFDINDPI